MAIAAYKKCMRPPSRQKLAAVHIPRRDDEEYIEKIVQEERAEEARQCRIAADTVRPGRMGV